MHYAFIKRFLANAPIIAKGSDEVIELVGAAGQENSPVGYASSVKLRKAVESGYRGGATPTMLQPSNGIPALNFISIINNCPHLNAAKLFIKYWMGGEDGQCKDYSFFIPRHLGAAPRKARTTRWIRSRCGRPILTISMPTFWTWKATGRCIATDRRFIPIPKVGLSPLWVSDI